MDIYTLNPGFRLQDPVIDTYESLIWTERYSAESELTLTIPDSPKVRDLIPEGTFLSIPVSREVMIVETRSSENGLLTIKGISLAGFLKERILRHTFTNYLTYWTLTGAPGVIAGDIVKHMCMTGVGNRMANNLVVVNGANEVIPNLKLGPLATGTSVEIAVEFGNVYDAVKKICDTYELGFSLYPSNVTESTYDLIFTTYAGRDLTSDQTVHDVVRFSPALDSLSGTNELRSISGYKNVAHAWAPNVQADTYIVGTAFAPGGSASRGFQRRTLLVNADDINDADVNDVDNPTGAAQLQAILVQRAKDALANNNYVRMIDGAFVPQKAYEYNKNFALGDVIELRNEYGAASKARITEFIHAQGSGGYAGYPTLSVISE